MIGNSQKFRLLLQPRDLHLLKEAATLKVFDRQQAQICAGFHSAARANVRLPKLVQAGLLKRFFIATESGGKKSLYSLTAKGAAAAGTVFEGIKRGKNQMLIGDMFVAHQLRINEVYLELKYKAIPIGGVKFKQWLIPSTPISNSAPIIPDGFFQLDSSGRTITAFLEVDLGGETSAVWAKKIAAYVSLATTGQFEQIFKEPQFRVVVITTTDRRVKLIQKLTAQLTDKIFWFSTFQLINRSGFWSPVWVRPAADQLQAFIQGAS